MLKQLWAPWRLDYVANTPPQKRKGCFLCEYRDQPERDAENFVVARGAHSIVVLNRFPYNNGHLLIAPLQHKAGLDELTDEEQLDLWHQIRDFAARLKGLLHYDGLNIGLNLGAAAGAGLPGHLHWHLVPRWNGDTNFMPVLANVKVIPQSLRALHTLLTEDRSNASNP
ncbi:MAG: HIT domain-containing protein [Planctomycetota bacterium]|nr:MAG: HIT domain-containing protein [Planctomycetota bacterium]